jgi:putative flippase GtrA
MNRTFTFGSTDEKMVAEAARFGSATLVSMGIALVMMYLLVDGAGLNYLLASALIAVGMTFFNFFLHSTWSFRPPDHSKRS